ncbi:hypothetical protein EST38_g12665 [Candolleomyces aberdarensis]|uniref:Uncharacterized protein n=1 Tax=Candolleomyces aberdarensis TaxID=2316362 RepID=A0A4V1Q1Y3_9AGAR|nr:hypothetical protein EST38_g12665 [Candolleomyces aberdarensis]
MPPKTSPLWMGLGYSGKQIRSRLLSQERSRLIFGHIQPGKRPIDLIFDFPTCLSEYTRYQITRDIGAVVPLNKAKVQLTAPAAWVARTCEITHG